jgi:aminopeptidase N
MSPLSAQPLPATEDREFTVLGYDLDLEYRVGSHRLDATAIVTATATERLTRVTLDLAGLVASKVSVNGAAASRFSQHDGVLGIRPSRPLPAGMPFTVMIRYGGFPHPVRVSGGEAGWGEEADGATVTCLPGAAATWFPSDGRAEAVAPVRIRISCDRAYTVASTGAAHAPVARGNRTIWQFDATEPVSADVVRLEIRKAEAS